MTRHLLIRSPEDEGSIVKEASLPTEAELHDALTRHPELIPLSDLGMGEGVVIGRESSLAGGYADLVIADDAGGLCIVEVKNSGNPDTRRVVAQLLDYASSLWGATLEDLDSRVLAPYLSGMGPVQPYADVGDFIAHSTAGDEASPVEAASIAERLTSTLATGDFALVVAAPQIPPGVQRVIEYLNARGQRLYGLEVSYFKGTVECFVPRLVVRPLASSPAGASSAKPSIDRETFLESVPEVAAPQVAEFLDECEAAGAELSWNKSGPSIFVSPGPRRQVGYVETTRLGIVQATPSGFPEAPFEAARTKLAEAAIGTETATGWFRSISLKDSHLSIAIAALLELVATLLPEPQWAMLDTPIEGTFTRNDFNVWQAHVRELAEVHGKLLRATFADQATGKSATAHLTPLGGGQPGWRPTFRPAIGRSVVWGDDTLGQEIAIRIDAVAG